jgi:hypothetical protein
VVYVTGVSKLKVSVIIYSATLRAAVFLNLVIAVLTVTAAAVLLQTNWTMLRLEVCNCNKWIKCIHKIMVIPCSSRFDCFIICTHIILSYVSWLHQSNSTSIHMRRQPSLSCIWGISKRLWQLSSRCNLKCEMCAIIIRPNDHFAHYSRKDNLRVFAAEWAVVFGVLCHFHLLDNFTKSSTISGAVLPANSNLFSVISLWNSFEDIIINWTETSNKITHLDFCLSASTSD